MGGPLKISSIERIVRRVILAVSRASGVPVNKINTETTIDEDIAIDGDDVTELLDALDRGRKIDWTGFDFYDYFHDEGQISRAIPKLIVLLPYWALRFLLKKPFPGMPTFIPNRPNESLKVIELAGTVHNRSWEHRYSIPSVNTESIEEWTAKFTHRFNQRHRRRKKAAHFD